MEKLIERLLGSNIAQLNDTINAAAAVLRLVRQDNPDATEADAGKALFVLFKGHIPLDAKMEFVINDEVKTFDQAALLRIANWLLGSRMKISFTMTDFVTSVDCNQETNA